MAFSGADEMTALLNLLPILDQAAVHKAVVLAGKRFSDKPEKVAMLRDGLNDAFNKYFVERMCALWAAKAPPSETAARIKRIAAAADRLVMRLRLEGLASPSSQPGPANELLRIELISQANLYAKEIGGFANMPPRHGGAKEEGRTQRPDYRGDEKLRELIDAILLWQTILRRAHAFWRKNVTPAGQRKRRKPNNSLDNLFDDLNSVWMNVFAELPADGWSANTDSPDGPYFRFLKSLFVSIISRLDPRITSEYPELADDLRLSRHAIRARYRKTVEGKLPGMVKQMAQAAADLSADDLVTLVNSDMARPKKKKS
jgi:hypothetical protein